MTNGEYQFRIAEIDVAKHATDEKIVGIFRLESNTPGKQGPLLLIVAEIQSTLYVYERLLDVLNATAEQARYLTSGVDQDPVGRFEKLVQRLNETVAAFSETESTPLSWNRINMFVMELSRGHLCVTGIGSLMNIFLQKQEDGTFRSFDLFGSLEQPEDIDPKKPFASLICGDMAPGDILIAGSPNLERLRNDLRLKERLTTLPPVTAALEIRQDLEKRAIPDHFIAAIVTCHEPKPIAAPAIEPSEAPTIASTASIQKLRSTEDEVHKHLSPVIAPMTPIMQKPAIKGLMQKAGQTFSGIIKKFQKKSANAPQREPDAMALASLRGMNAGYGNMFTRKKKLALIGIVSAVVLGSASIAWWRHSQKIAALTAAWNATYEQALDQKNKAESDLIYGNESQARTSISQAEHAISTLPTDTAERTNRIQQLTQGISELKEKLKKIVKLDNVTELLALPATASDGSLSAPVLTSDAAYAIDAAENHIVKIDLANKTIKRIKLPDNATSIVSGAMGASSIMFATAQGSLYALKKSDDTVDRMPWTHAKSSSTVDIAFYASKIYSLEPTHNQVWRSQNSGGAFGQEAAYIKAASVALENAVAISIDSNVYILKQDGTLVRFLSGGQEGFSLATIDPPLRAASGLWTDAEDANLYLTDPSGVRVLVFDKNGQLKAQLTSSQFRAPRDIAADETNKRAIVVDGNRLLLVPLP